LAWLGLAWLGLAWLGLAWLGLVTLLGVLDTERAALLISETSVTIFLPKFHNIALNFGLHQQYRHTLL
jgi:hypothetical protein